MGPLTMRLIPAFSNAGMRFAAHSSEVSRRSMSGGSSSVSKLQSIPSRPHASAFFHLVGTDEDAVLLLTVVARGARVAHYRGLAVEASDLVEVLGHQILVGPC